MNMTAVHFEGLTRGSIAVKWLNISLRVIESKSAYGPTKLPIQTIRS